MSKGELVKFDENVLKDRIYSIRGFQVMLAGVLKSETAVKISIMIIEAFVAMRKFIQANGQIFQRLDRIEVK